MEINHFLFQEILDYIEENEIQMELIWGKGKEIESLISDGDMPKLYYKLKDLDNRQIKNCLKCGKEFIVNHGHQKFCPPKEGRKRSSCEGAYNQALKRKRMKEKENISL